MLEDGSSAAAVVLASSTGLLFASLWRAGGAWAAIAGHAGEQVHRDRPWYRHKITPTFTDMLGALRLQMWRHEIYGPTGSEGPSPEIVETLLHKMSAVA